MFTCCFKQCVVLKLYSTEATDISCTWSLIDFFPVDVTLATKKKKKKTPET